MLLRSLQLVAHYYNKTDGLLSKLTVPCSYKGYIKKERSTFTADSIHSLITNYFVINYLIN